MALLGSGFDPANPTNTSAVSQGATWIRDIKARLVAFLGVSFDLDTGALLASAIPNPVPTPFGAAGTVLTSTGVGTQPAWSASTGVQPGTIFMFGGAAAPAGYLTCIGGTQLIATYPALAAVLGTTYGGDGVTTFGIPDLRGRAPVGVGTGDAADATAWSLAGKRGTETHTLVAAEMPAHNHAIVQANANADGNDYNTDEGLTGHNAAGAAGDNTKTSTDAGADGAHNNLQPSIGLTFIVKT